VDLIYRGLLGYGRPAPTYARSTADTVVLEMSCGEVDLGFVEMVLNEENRRSARLPIDTLLVLELLRRERRVDVADVARTIQKDVSVARGVIEWLVEVGLVTAHGVKKGRTYTSSPKVYRRGGQADGFVRQAGFDAIQQEEMVKRYVREHGAIRRRDVMDLCRLNGAQATRLLKKLTDCGALLKRGEKRWTRYEPGPAL